MQNQQASKQESVIFAWKLNEFEQLLKTCEVDDEVQISLKHLGDKNAKILEAGCGLGRVVKYLFDCGYKNISGIKFDEASVKYLNTYHPELDIVQGDILKMPYLSKSFDAVLCYGVVEHFPVVGPSVPLKELFKVLRPGGKAIITVPSFNIFRRISYMLNLCDVRKWTLLRKIFNKSLLKRNGKDRGWYVDPQFGAFFEYRFTPKQFENLCEASGFEIINSVPIAHMDGMFHLFGHKLVEFKNWEFHPSKPGLFLNYIFSKIPFLHNHMHLCVLKKPELSLK